MQRQRSAASNSFEHPIQRIASLRATASQSLNPKSPATLKQSVIASRARRRTM
jgi:hypothetical protein